MNNHHSPVAQIKKPFVKLAKSFLSFFVVKPVLYVKRNTNTRLDEAREEQNLNQILWKRAQEASADYIEPKLNQCMLYPVREKLWDFSLAKADSNGLFAEFGVFTGTSINHFARLLANKNIRIYGFDSFEGLKEEWYGTEGQTGYFDVGGRMPKVLPNVTLVKGWFDNTLPVFLQEHPGHFSFLHLDADTYESTLLVLNLVKDRLRKGTVIIFDEYLGYPNWKEGEYLAWQQFCEKNQIQYRYLAFSIYQATVQII